MEIPSEHPEPVPFLVPFTDHAEANAVLETIQSHWLTSGPRCRDFEAALVEYLGEGVEVLLPTLTFTTTADVVR